MFIPVSYSYNCQYNITANDLYTNTEERRSVPRVLSLHGRPVGRQARDGALPIESGTVDDCNLGDRRAFLATTVIMPKTLPWRKEGQCNASIGQIDNAHASSALSRTPFR